MVERALLKLKLDAVVVQQVSPMSALRPAQRSDVAPPERLR